MHTVTDEVEVWCPGQDEVVRWDETDVKEIVPPLPDPRAELVEGWDERVEEWLDVLILRLYKIRG